MPTPVITMVLARPIDEVRVTSWRVKGIREGFSPRANATNPKLDMIEEAPSRKVNTGFGNETTRSDGLKIACLVDDEIRYFWREGARHPGRWWTVHEGTRAVAAPR